MDIEKTSILKWADALQKAQKSEKTFTIATHILKLASLPRRQRVSVNLSKLDEHATGAENIIVPGKILGTGVMTKKVNIAAIEYSASALQQLKKAGCTVLTIDEILKKGNLKVIM